MFIQKNAVIVYGIVTVVLLAILSALLFGVARTGIVTVPFFSRWYVAPVASRVVAPAPVTSEQFLQTIQSRVQAASQTGQPPYRVTVTEQEVSGALQSSVKTALRADQWERTEMTAVIHPTDLEIVGAFARGPIHPQFIVRFVPVVERGALRFDPVSAQIGDVPLPASWMTPILGWIFSRDFGVWTISFGSLSLQRVQLSDGSLELQIAPST